MSELPYEAIARLWGPRVAQAMVFVLPFCGQNSACTGINFHEICHANVCENDEAIIEGSRVYVTSEQRMVTVDGIRLFHHYEVRMGLRV